MIRIMTLLLLAVLLLPAPPPGKPMYIRPGPLLVSARPLPLADEPGITRVGRLAFRQAWALSSAHPGFGGISALLVTPPGQVLALNDSGVLMGFHVGADAPTRRPFIAPLPLREGERGDDWRYRDSEAMTHDPESDRYWVGFELQQMICRYGPGFVRVEACRVWPQILSWPKTGSIESLARLPDGRFLAIGEMGMTRQGEHEALLFVGDPAAEDTPPPTVLRYAAPRGYRPTDAVALDDKRVIVLHRRVTLLDLFTATVAVVDIPSAPRPGTVLTPSLLARLAPPLLADNFEGMAITREAGESMLWIISDDNHESFQRTLLLKFALPKDL